MTHRVAPLVLVALLGGCAALPPPAPAPLFVDSASSYEPPTRDSAQVVFLAPADMPAAADANALFELDGDRRTLIAVIAGHGASLQRVKPGHHVFMAYGRSAHLLEADVEGGARYYVALRPVGNEDLQPLPTRTAPDAEFSNASPEFTGWMLATTLVDKTAAADAWFAKQDAQVAAAQADAQAAWRRMSAQERAALTLDKGDAVLH